KIKISIVSNKSFSGVQVKDEGNGMNTEQQKKIFTPFFRLDNETALKAEGTGLGLTIVKHILDAHNGKIDVEIRTFVRSLKPRQRW
ncbi:MAG: ATP-binding protein, partial [Deltaproteobacteria bacterium]